MAKPLTATHFKPQQRVPVSAMPAAVKLGMLLSDGCQRALARHAAVSWRVAADRIEESNLVPAEAYAQAVRFESASGSLTMQMSFDQPAVSAVMEALLGGTGTEQPFDMGERPVSRIEAGILRLLCGSLAEEVALALGGQFGRPFSHFPEEDKPSTAGTGQDWASFHLLVNVFGHSGEICLSMPRAELAQQIKAAAPESEGLQDEMSRQQLRRQVSRSAVELQVTLGPETLSVEDIANLRPGRMIALSSTVSAPVTVWSGGVAAFEGKLARAGDRLAVSLTAVAT